MAAIKIFLGFIAPFIKFVAAGEKWQKMDNNYALDDVLLVFPISMYVRTIGSSQR